MTTDTDDFAGTFYVTDITRLTAHIRLRTSSDERAAQQTGGHPPAAPPIQYARPIPTASSWTRHFPSRPSSDSTITGHGA